MRVPAVFIMLVAVLLFLFSLDAALSSVYSADTSIVMITVEVQAAQPYIPASQQQVQEPKKYTGGAIPSRSFRILQQMTTPESIGEQARPTLYPRHLTRSYFIMRNGKFDMANLLRGGLYNYSLTIID